MAQESTTPRATLAQDTRPETQVPQNLLSGWAMQEVAGGGWIRRMFSLGQDLKARYPERPIYDLSLGQPFPVSDRTRDAFQKATARSTGQFAYMPNSGYVQVRERVAAEAGLPVEAIVMTSGAAGALSVLLRALVNPESTVIGFAPFFAEFASWSRAAGAAFVAIPPLPQDNSSLNLAEFEAAISPTAAAVIINSPNNPSGHVMTVDEARGIVDILLANKKKTGRMIPVLLDEVYHQLTYCQGATAGADLLERSWPLTFRVRSYSKDLGLAGERIGYMVLPEMLRTRQFLSTLEATMRCMGQINAPATAQMALLHLDTLMIDPRPAATLMQDLVSAAEKLGISAQMPDGGIYLWIQSTGEDALPLCEKLAERGVIVAPGIAFGAPSALRLCVTGGRETVLPALQIISQELATG